MRNLKRSGYFLGSLAALSVSCLLAPAAQAATITAAGLDTTTQPNWRTTTTIKALDGDGDNVYGTAGYIAYATGSTNASTYDDSAATKLSGLPAYLTITANGVNNSYTGGYALFDNPTLAPGASVLDIHSGFAYRANNLANTSLNLYDLIFGASTPTLLRIGVIQNGAGGPIASFTLTGGGSATQLVNKLGSDDGIIRYAFFDVANAAGSTLTLSGLSGLVGDNVGLSGFTVDAVAIPEPASLGLLGLGAIAMLRRRRA